MNSDKAKQNLIILDQSNNFGDWLYSQIKPFLSGNILEIGSGLGTYSEKITRDFPQSRIILSDIDQEYLARLKEGFRSWGNVASILHIDFSNPSDLKKIKQKVHSVLAMNVLEHIQNDLRALNNGYNLLEKRGRLILVVPAHKFLFNCIDRLVGHYRRYTKREIMVKAREAGFQIKQIFYFNFFSIFGWYLQGNLLKKPLLGRRTAKFLDRMVPGLSLFEKYILRQKIGMSLIVVLEKG